MVMHKKFLWTMYIRKITVLIIHIKQQHIHEIEIHTQTHVEKLTGGQRSDLVCRRCKLWPSSKYRENMNGIWIS